MNTRLIEDIAAAVLYEGYLLYPYRASATKNRQRWTFGVLYPRTFAEESVNDAWSMQTECLLRAAPESEVAIRVRFLHLLPAPVQSTRTTEPGAAGVAELLSDAEGRTGPVRASASPHSAQGARECEIALSGYRISALVNATRRQRIDFPAESGHQPLSAILEAKAERVHPGLYRLRVGIFNATPSGTPVREQALLQSMVSTHTILGIDGGEFVSLLDPPQEFRDAADGCRNIGTWPVLAGEEGSLDAMLSSPIILYDYPQIAPESPGALFDGTEIDEILTLRILTLTDDEKAEMALADERTREILARTEAMPPEQFMKLHGVLRGFPAPSGGPQEAE